METLLHVSTRWLSLEMVVSRILRLYKALRSYFGSIRKYKPSLMILKNIWWMIFPSNVTMYHFLCKKMFFGLSQVARNMRMFQIIIHFFGCACSLTPQMKSKPGVSGCVKCFRTQCRRSISYSTSRHWWYLHISTCSSSGKTLVSVSFMNKYITLIVAFSLLFVVALSNIFKVICLLYY